MHTTITTVITSRIDLDTFKPDHSVRIEPEDDGFPTEVIYAVVRGACKATLNSLPERGSADNEAEDDD